MDIRQNPFSLYDFLGYFIPGTIFLIGLGTLPYLSDSMETIAESVITTLHLNEPGFYLPFILVAYLLGHTLSFLSAVTIENYALWSVGYPSKFLLGIPYPNYYEATEYRPKDYKYVRVLIRTLILIILAPITFLDFIFSLLKLRELLYARPLNPILSQTINKKLVSFAKKHSGLEPKVLKDKKIDLFPFAYHFAVENAKAHLPKMQNYVALYGFTRTINVVVVILFWIIFGFALQNNSLLQYSGLIIWMLGFSYLFFLNFMKFYRRFSLEVLMAISVIS